MSSCCMSRFTNSHADCHYTECCYAECRYAECRYAECRYAECRYSESRGALNYGSKLFYCKRATFTTLYFLRNLHIGPTSYSVTSK